MSKIQFPTHAKIKKGTDWDKTDNYGGIWCPIREIQLDRKEMSLIHPKYGGFAWVDMEDTILKIEEGFELYLCDDCGEMLPMKGKKLCKQCFEDSKDHNC